MDGKRTMCKILTSSTKNQNQEIAQRYSRSIDVKAHKTQMTKKKIPMRNNEKLWYQNKDSDLVSFRFWVSSHTA